MKELLLDLRSIKKSYGQGKAEIEVLKDINLAVNSGESHAILGQSGSGKSTLLSILCGIQKANSGSYMFKGEDFFKLSEDDVTVKRAQSIGTIFQQFHLLPHLTALENVELSLEILERYSELDHAGELLKKVGLWERRDHYPSELSGGEQQRVAIARSMAIRPDLILADEPSGSLDEETGDHIMNLIFDLVKEHNTGLILVTHNKTLAARCDNVHELRHGVFN